MPYTYQNVSESTTISLSTWNGITSDTTFTPLVSTTPYEGYLNPYIVTNKRLTINNVTSFSTRYIGNRDIRSNYMRMAVNPALITNNTWTTLTNTNCTVTTFNNYHTSLTGDGGGLNYGRFTYAYGRGIFNTSACTISTPSSDIYKSHSLYLIYANLRYDNPSGNVANAYVRIFIDYYGNQTLVSSIATDKQTNSITSGTTTYYQTQYFTGGFTDTAYPEFSDVYGISFYASTSVVNPVIEFGYLEIISPGEPCGKSIT